MNRLVLVPCVVVASYVALASYLVWPTLVYEHGGSRSALKIPTSAANRGEILKVYGPPTSQTSAVFSTREAPSKPVPQTTAPTPAVWPESHELMWVTVLLPARVHAGPSVDTPILQFYTVGTPLHATRFLNDWIEVTGPGSSKSGWIYRKYLGAISNPEQGKIASQEAEEQKSVAQPVQVKRYAKAFPVKRYVNATRSSKRSTHVGPVTPKPTRGPTEMASLLQR